MKKSLFDYEFLVNEVFYRSCHILRWIEKLPNMSSLDKEAICATIMDALVYKRLINPEKEFINELCITDDICDYHYEKHPFVSGIPLWLKEEFRHKSLIITGSIPVSIALTKPASKVAQYCVFDPNTAVSSFFDEFRFIIADYDSPTRLGIRAVDRPFVEVSIDGILYLVDILTKRVFRSDMFFEKYNVGVKSSIRKSEFTEEKMAIYNEQTSIKEDLGIYLSMSMLVLESLKQTDEFAEMMYEIEKSKEYYPDGWKDYEELKQHKFNFVF